MWSFGGTSQGSGPGQGAAPGFGGGFGSASGMVFGSGAPMQQQQQQQQREEQQREQEMDEPFDYEKAKMEALQSMPTFSGNTNKNTDQAQDNIEDLKRKKDRAARFSTASTSAIDARKVQVQQASTSTAEKKAIIGTCEDMCPAAERERRQNMSDIQIFERVHPDNMNQTSAELAVKRFARTVDDPHPSDFRTRAALERTMTYLRTLLDREDVRFGLVHKFLWDRYRSVRQDLYIQGITDHFAINIFEEIVRFHVLCEHELCGEDQSVTDMEGFNSHLNMEQMNKALISLNDMYEKSAEKGEHCPNEAEFRSYHLLSLMSQHGKFKGDQQGFLSTLQSLRQDVRDSTSIQWVLQLRSAFAFGNFARFFMLIKQAPYLLSCLSHIYFPQMRAKCLKIMSETVIPGRPVSLEASWLVRVLLLDSQEEALHLAKLHGFESSLNDHSEAAIILIKGDFVPLPTPIERHPSKYISQRAPGKRSECVISSTPAPDAEAVMAAAKEAQEALRKQYEEQRERERLAKEEQDRRQRLLREKQEEEQRERERREQEQIARQREHEERERRQREENERREKERIEALAREEMIRQEMARREQEERERKERLERLRLEEEARQEMERRRAEEERRKYLIAKLKEGILAQKYWNIWLAETRSRVLEKERLRRSAMNLKGCRVGAAARHIRKRVYRSEAPSFPDVKRGHEFVGVAEVAEPILREKNPNMLDLLWKVSILSPHETFMHDPLARCLHSFALFGGYSRDLPGRHGEIVYQESGLLRTCMQFVSGWSISTKSLLEHFHGSSALILVADKSNIEMLTSDVRQALAMVTSDIWKGPSIPILLMSLDSKSHAFLENGFHVRVISPTSLQDRASLEEAIAWVASSSPQQPSFSVTSLKESITQGIRSFINPHRMEIRKRKGLQLLSTLTPQEAAIDVVVKAIEASFTSVEACWKWPPREFDCGPLNDWYDPSRYMVLIKAVRDIFTEIDKIALGEGAYQSSLLINSIIDRCTSTFLEANSASQDGLDSDRVYGLPIVIPQSVASHGEFDRILELSIPDYEEISEEDTVATAVVSRETTVTKRRASQHSHVAKKAYQSNNDENLRSQLNTLEEEVYLEKMLWNPKFSR